MDEQRKTPRLELDRPIDQFVLCADASGACEQELYLAARVENLSAGGIAASCGQALQSMSRVYVVLTLPGGLEIRSEGYVTHARMEGETCRFGVRFTDLDGYTEMKIAELLGASGG